MTPSDLIKAVTLDKPEEQNNAFLEESSISLEIPQLEGADIAADKTNEYAHCIAVMGAVGGVGATSLCVQLAHNLALESQKNRTKAERLKEPRVCLVDLDFEGGACAHHIDITPNMSVGDLTASPERVDRAYVSALTATHDSGFDLLATPNSLAGNDSAHPATIVAILDIVSQMYEHIIIDIPRYWRPWNMAAIGASDKFLMLTELTIPSLHLARMRVSAIEEKFGRDVRADIILNKYERRSFRNSLREKDAETALKREITAAVCTDADTLREAINCGEPAGVVRPDSRYVKDTRKLLKLLLTQHKLDKRSAA